MAKTALLDTKTQTLIELIGNGKHYRVPPYQRDYSWSDEHWEDLWNDVVDLVGNPDERHYMGALVVAPASDRELQIIDGQQRLATLSILALAIIDRLNTIAHAGTDSDSNLERSRTLRNRFIGEKDPASLIESSKLFLNETDDPFYQDYLVQLRVPLNPRGLPRSNRSMWDCFLWFREQLEGLPIASNGEALARLLNDTIARQLLFIAISVDDELNAYTVFETLNARGLELSSTDLLKNYLFSKASVKADVVALQRRWRALVATVRMENFPAFLRYFLLCERPIVRSAKLFKLMRDRVRSLPDAFALVDALQGRSEIFAALSDVNHGFWIETPACKKPVRELNLFKTTQMMPLLFAAWEKFSKTDFVKVMKLLSIITFRYTVVSRLNTNTLEPVYHRAANAVLSGKATTPSHVFDILRPIYVEDEPFKQNFAYLDMETSGQRKQLVKYILCCLEADMSSIDRPFETDAGTVEHVLPENPSAAWEDAFPQDQWSKSVYRLGNLILLEGPINRRVGNQGFAEKQAAYTQSQYAMAKSIVASTPDSWNLDALDQRQQQMAARAAHIWRSDFI